ncbi:DNA-binding transcriptional regulator Fis [Candidatus Njordibacter sp. Uisw_039]|jgi:Fis family transcriptional regulator|uniref:DNA-binding transcriptional regulator Fis n=2 Tax=Candidatus Njordibacter sp. Uisw_039 TaxID=3230972 RepID=UPI003A2F4A37|tara:strand:+ start:4324 stop:4650 length:327 start_codon:yes stop_codon:yes gene_type:complete
MSYNIKNTMNSMHQATDINQTVAQDHQADQRQVPQSLRQSVEQSLTQYFNELDGQQTSALYNLFMQQVEAPLFECVMQHTQDNQSKAAAILGLNRGTLRKKLKQYDLL